MRRFFLSTAILSAALLTYAITPGQSQNSGDGQSIFRFDTFGNEQFWTDVLRMQRVILTILKSLSNC